MEQQTLFDPNRSIADTSRAALARHEASGKGPSHRERMLEAVRMYPGKTSLELAALVGLERHQAASRLAELKRDGLVKQGDPRTCVQNPRDKAVTWWIAL